MTTISFAPNLSQAISILPSISSLIMLPAIRMETKSPKPESKIISGEVLESMQLITTAIGNCPSDVAFT